jgi:hypothetical protein
MTKLPTDVAFDLLVVEQLHDIVKCEDDSGCDRAAHWMLRCTGEGCSVVDFLCTPHRAEFEQWAEPLDWVKCTKCQTPLARPLPWVAL